MHFPGVIFRVASAPSDGGGHIGRCLSLAVAVTASAPVGFVLDADGSAWEARITQHGFSVLQDDEVLTCDACVLDGYRFSPSDIARWRQCGSVLMGFDDFDNLLPGADLVVRPWSLHEGDGDRVLSGLQHAVIDPRYAEIPGPSGGPVRRILVSFGYRDSANVTALVLSRLGTRWVDKERAIEIVAVLGSAAPHKAEIATLAERHGFRLLINVPDFRSLLETTDLAIGAPGISALERAAAGIPSILVSLAENQRRMAIALSGAGAAIDLGSVDDLDKDTLIPAIETLMADGKQRNVMAAAARRAVDGNGSARVAEALMRKMGHVAHAS